MFLKVYRNAAITYVVVAALFISGIKGEELTEYKITMDPDDKFNVSWSFRGSGPQDEITFTVEVETTGWVGLGFSPQGSMAGADIVIAWVDTDGKVYLQDMMANSNSLPQLDSSQDVKLVFGAESDGKTTVTFSRKISTCDEHDNPLKKDTTRLIFAYGLKDPSANILSSSDYHGAGRRGSKSVYLFDPKKPAGHVPEDARSWDLTNIQYEVPSDHTTYHCSFHTAPKLDRKHHLIAIKPIITRGNEGVVHHIVLYSCWNVTEAHFTDTTNTQGVCFGPDMPDFDTSCLTVIYAWAVGGGDYYYPKETGFALGTEDLNSPDYFKLEVHYDNPTMRSGMLDSSGFKLVYTPTIRDTDVGMLDAGTVDGILVPPTAEQFEVTAYCHGSCTNEWIPEEGITLFSYFLHAHLLGVQIKAEVFRDGKPGEILAVDNAYDFNFQENRLYHQTKKLYPGDTVKMTCTYDASKRSEPTLGGLSVREEMCLGFFGYYPRQDTTRCRSLPSFFVDGGHEAFRVLGARPKYQPSPNDKLIDMRSSFASLSWNDGEMSTLQDLGRKSSHITECRDKTFTPVGAAEFTVDEYRSIAEKNEEFKHCNSSAANASNLLILSVIVMIQIFKFIVR